MKRVEKPAIVRIGVSTADIPWPKIADYLRSCRVILDTRSLHDVEVEIRVANVTQAAAGPALLPADIDINLDNNTIRQLYTTSVGQSLACKKSPEIHGTPGLYFRAARSSSTDLYALTCRHVALPKSVCLGNRPYRRRFPSQPANKMIIPASDSLESWNVEFRNLTEARKRSLEHAQQRQAPDPMEIQAAQFLLDKATEWGKTLISLQLIDNRVVGDVFFSPPIAQALDNNETP